MVHTYKHLHNIRCQDKESNSDLQLTCTENETGVKWRNTSCCSVQQTTVLLQTETCRHVLILYCCYSKIVSPVKTCFIYIAMGYIILWFVLGFVQKKNISSLDIFFNVCSLKIRYNYQLKNDKTIIYTNSSVHYIITLYFIFHITILFHYILHTYCIILPSIALQYNKTYIYHTSQQIIPLNITLFLFRTNKIETNFSPQVDL